VGTDAGGHNANGAEVVRNAITTNATAGRALLGQEPNDSTPVIPEAFLVEGSDGNVVDAQPLLPWWKQKRTVLSVMFLMLVAAAIAVAVTLVAAGGKDPEYSDMLISDLLNTTAPSSSLAPSSSVSPSFSRAPSVSPTACFGVEISVNSSDTSTYNAWKLRSITKKADDSDDIKS